MLNGNFMDWDNSLNTLGLSPSGPAYIFVFSFFSTSSMVKIIEAAYRLWYFCAISGMLSISSGMNTFEKY